MSSFSFFSLYKTFFKVSVLSLNLGLKCLESFRCSMFIRSKSLGSMCLLSGPVLVFPSLFCPWGFCGLVIWLNAVPGRLHEETVHFRGHIRGREYSLDGLVLVREFVPDDHRTDRAKTLKSG